MTLSNLNTNLIPVGDLTPVLNILTSEDAESLLKLKNELSDTWTKKQIFRTETEMRISVLNDAHHPTTASKYWQAVREQSSHFEQLMILSFSIRRNEIKRQKLYKKYESTTDSLKKAEIQVDLDENLFTKASLEQEAKDRIRELNLWSKLKNELDDGSFDIQNVNTHQAESLQLKLYHRANTLTEHSGMADIVNTLGSLSTLERLKEEGVIKLTPELKESEQPKSIQ
jgi:hypothetical protein